MFYSKLKEGNEFTLPKTNVVVSQDIMRHLFCFVSLNSGLTMQASVQNVLGKFYILVNQMFCM